MDNSIRLGDTDMYYVKFGSGPKNLVVLPGLSDGLATVKGKSLVLKTPYKKHLNDYTVYMFSRKNKMPEGYSIRDMARDQAEALKTLGIDNTALLGVSQGGMISQYIAIDHPEAISKLVLAVTAPYANKVATDAVSSWIRMARSGDHTALMTDTAEKMYTKAYLEKFLKYVPLTAKLTKPKSYDRFYANAEAILKFDARDELHKIKCPTLIISGDDDNTVGNDAPYELQNGIENSSLHIYKGLGHSAFEEAKDFYDRIFEFLDN